MDISRWNIRRPLAVAAALALAAVTATACAEDDPGPNAGQPGQAGSGASIEILEPADGDTVTVPFEVRVASSAELGPIDQGLNHFHVWFGNGQPLIVESDSVMVEEAPNGEQTMFVSLQEADHTPIGEPVSITVTVEGGTDAPAPPPPNDY